MARFIMIDSTSGFIFGDTAAELVSHQSDWTEKTEADIIEAVRLMDEAIGEHGRRYSFQHSDPGASVTGYRIYDASADQVVCATDGQDAELINDVETCCPFLGFVRVLAADDKAAAEQMAEDAAAIAQGLGQLRYTPGASQAIEDRHPGWVHNAGDVYKHVRSGASLNVFHLTLFIWDDYVDITEALGMKMPLIDALFAVANDRIHRAVSAVEQSAAKPTASLVDNPYHRADRRNEIWREAWWRARPFATAEYCGPMA